MYSSEQCIVHKYSPAAGGGVAGLRDKSVDVELYIVFRCSEVALSPWGRSVHLPQSGVTLCIIARRIGHERTFTV
jgi:hypothetical protein